MKSNTGKYAMNEMAILLKTVENPVVEPFMPEILALVDAFGLAGHSEGEAHAKADIITKTIKKLLLQKPICEITGIAEEWANVSEMNGGETLYQNKRCYGLFKSMTGVATYVDAIVWKEPDGSGTNGSAMKQVHKYDPILGGNKAAYETIYSKLRVKSFPFKPKTFYIDVMYLKVKDQMQRVVKDEATLAEAFKYYTKD